MALSNVNVADIRLAGLSTSMHDDLINPPLDFASRYLIHRAIVLTKSRSASQVFARFRLVQYLLNISFITEASHLSSQHKNAKTYHSENKYRFFSGVS